MTKKISLKNSLLIIFFTVLISAGTILFFNNHFRWEEQFMNDKRVEEIADNNFMLSKKEVREKALQYITEEEAIEIAKKEGLQRGLGWIVGFYYRGTDDYDYVWAVYGQSGKNNYEKQIIINAKTEEVVSIMDIPIPQKKE